MNHDKLATNDLHFTKGLNLILACLLLLISMLWHRQAIFESKGDESSSSAECRIRTQGLRHPFAIRLNACWQTDWAIEDQAKNLNSTARPYDQQAFSPLDLTASWLSHLALAIYMFVVVNFDALAQASDIRIEKRQGFFFCWMQDSNPSISNRIPSKVWMEINAPLISYWLYNFIPHFINDVIIYPYWDS